jgi:hypothetical protein
MLAQIYAAIIYDRYCDMIAAASLPEDLDTIDEMINEDEERGTFPGNELSQLRELASKRREALAKENAAARGPNSDDGSGY